MLFLLFQVSLQLQLNFTSPTGAQVQSIVLKSYQTLLLNISISTLELPISWNGDIVELAVNTDNRTSYSESVQLRLLNSDSDDLTITLHISDALINATAIAKTTLSDKLIKSLQMTTSITSPQRASYGQPALFPILLSQTLLQNSLMPFNMPTGASYQLERVDWININEQLPSYSQEYWQDYSTNGITLIATSWLPFFSKCENYGNYVYLYNLIEDVSKCDLVDESKTKVINAIPTSGLRANADSCHNSLICYYAEDLTSDYEGDLWWQADNKALYYISKYALDYQFILQNVDDSKSQYFTSLISSQDEALVPVKFMSEGSLQDYVPSHFTLEILYNQKSSTDKEIVKVTVTASEYKSKLTTKEYTLEIVFKAMDYLELINSFQFDIAIYLLLYVFIGILAIGGIMMLWFFNKTVSSVRYPPKLRIKQTFLVAFLPAITGCIRATLPIIVYALILENVFANGLFSGIFYKYDSQEISADVKQVLDKGRTGLIILISGVAFLKIASKLVILKPDEEEQRLIKSNYEKLIEEKNYDFSEEEGREVRDSIKQQDEIKEPQNTIQQRFLPSDQSNPISRQSSMMQKVPGSAPIVQVAATGQKKSMFRRATILKANSGSFKDPSSPRGSISPQFQRQQSQQQVQPKNKVIPKVEYNILEDIEDIQTSKDYHYQVVCILTAVVILLFFGTSYMTLFYTNIYYFLIVLQVIDALFYKVLVDYLLQERMLVHPIMACLEVAQFVIFMAAESFQDFIFLYLSRLCLIIVNRTYVTPIFRNIKMYGTKLLQWLKIIDQNTIKQSIDGQKEQNIGYYLGKHSIKVFTEEQSAEYVIEMTLNYSSKLLAIFIKPIMLILIKIFQRETQIPNLYYIGFRQFDYYIYFAFLFMLPQVVIDIYLLNQLELIYGYKLLDYFDYCKYRNEYRIQKCFEHSLNMDRSISVFFRSIDNMKFTDQFYYNGSIVIYSIILCVLGTTIIIQNNYTFYEDPVIFLAILFLFIFIPLSQHLMIYLWNKLDVWKLPENKQKLALDSLDEFLNPIKENLEQIMEVDSIKRHFIELNKEWLINNLNHFITADMFTMQDEYLLQTYQQIINEERKVQKEHMRNQELIKKQKEIELKSRKKPRKATDLSQSVKSRDKYVSSHAEEPQQVNQTTIHIPKSRIETLTNILQIWYYQSKQNLFIKYLVQDVVQDNQAEQCKRCGLDIELRVVEIIPFEKMTNVFKFRTLGSPFNKFEWIRFYETHQKFITLCMDCEIGYRSRLLQRQNQSANDIVRQTQQNSIAKSIIYKWLYMARANLLHNH